MISTVLWLLYDFLPLINDIKVPSKTNMQKNSLKKVNDENRRIRIHLSEAWIRGSGSRSTPKSHGSATLVDTTPHISRVCMETYRRLISGWMRERRLSRMTCGSVITLAWHRIIATWKSRTSDNGTVITNISFSISIFLNVSTYIFIMRFGNYMFPPVLGIRIRNRIQNRMFLGPPDPDPLVRGADPDPDPVGKL